jgi:hypothetical protein
MLQVNGVSSAEARHGRDITTPICLTALAYSVPPVRRIFMIWSLVVHYVWQQCGTQFLLDLDDGTRPTRCVADLASAEPPSAATKRHIRCYRSCHVYVALQVLEQRTGLGTGPFDAGFLVNWSRANKKPKQAPDKTSRLSVKG